jgi:hypothetical protein
MMSVVVEQETVYFDSVDVRADAPVAVHRFVPVGPLRLSFTRGNIVPTVPVFFIHTVKVAIAPTGT